MKAKAFSVGGENYDFNASLTSENKQVQSRLFKIFVIDKLLKESLKKFFTYNLKQEFW